MSKPINTYNRQNWKDSEFPVLSQTCLGFNPYVLWNDQGDQGALSNAKSAPVRSQSSGGVRERGYALKNGVCQTCLLDLPTQVRDAALKIHDNIPESNVNKEYYIQMNDVQLKAGGDKTVAAGIMRKLLAKLARKCE
ncbi:AAEL013282-PA [Aedes aegypti]|uniref:AAEL013282-PA n=1 Tax=Aedes aegypti TaxID=7159 RepID=Q16JN1_AEDAE|nr:AAEL013282-PA [Aedes aegypti]